jgi:3-oxoacyl-[acyl-carrier-protein] synthase II
MSNALRDAKITTADIDYINAHGTSTPLGDAIELAAVERLFTNYTNKILMSSTKSATGHLLGAAGSVELIFSILSMRDQVAPPTLNLHNPITTPIDLVPIVAKPRKINYVLSNSFGFGGTNASLVIKKL